MILDNTPSQQFTKVLNKEAHDFRVTYNSRYDFWTCIIDEKYFFKLLIGIDLVKQFPLYFGLRIIPLEENLEFITRNNLDKFEWVFDETLQD